MLGLVGQSTLSAWEYASEAGAPLYTTYTSDSHGGGAITSDIAEDRLGNLFFANEAGLLKYDGVRWSRMPETGQTYYTTSVTIDGRDRIWATGVKHIGYYEANTAGAYDYTDMTESVMALPQSQHFTLFWQLYADGEQIYLITSFYVLRWDGNEWKVWPRFETPLRILSSWLDNTLYVYARGSGLFRLDGEEFRLIAEETPEVASGIISIPAHSDKGLLCITLTNGLFYLKDGQFESVSTANHPLLQQTMLFHSKQCENGALLICTLNQGTLIIDRTGRLIHQINDNNAVTYRVILDRFGAAWAATSAGIIQIKGLPVAHYADAAHDIGRHQKTLFYTNLNELKAITPKDTSRRDNPQKFSTARAWDLFSNGTDLLIGNTQGLAVLTNEADLVQRPHARPIMYLFPSEYDSSLIYSAEPPKLGRWQKLDDEWLFIDTLDTLKSVATSLVELPNRNLLLSGENGPIFYASWPRPDFSVEEPATVTALGSAQGLPDQFAWTYCLRIHETVVVISNQGLYRFDLETETFTFDPILGNDLGNDVYGLEACPLADNDGWLLHLPSTNSSTFISGQIGALRIQADESFAWEPWQLPSVHQVGKVEALFHEKIDGKETLWVGGSKDLLRYDLSNLEIPPAPPVRLTAITENTSNSSYYGGAGDLPNNIEWSFPQKSLHFEFAAPPSTLEVAGYQTRLVGFEEEWSSPNERTFRDYTNLYEGNYCFEVRTVDEFGRTGPPDQQHFAILPPLYRTWYAYIGYIISGSILIALGVRWWTLRLRKRNEELEAMVNQRTIDLERRQIELIEANNVKQDFLANMSHEIRNPLNGILGITRLMRDDHPSERLTHLYSCANHLHQLLGQTLDYSSLEAGKLSLHPQEFSPTQLADEVIGMHKGLLDEKGLQLHVELPEVNRHWIGDPVLLRQILINLISNAVKYTENGSVRVKLSYEVNQDTVTARFEVADTGSGIPAEKQDYIFEKFTRLSKAAESTVSGTGLGLAIASEMAGLMGGTLTLDTQVERGATFVLTLPFKLGDEVLQSDVVADGLDNTQALRGRRVLIADDMDFNRYVNKEVLEKIGATVHEATDGKLALEAIKSQNFDIAILDINMPEMTGIQVVQSVLSDSAILPPKFVALSAHTTAKMQASCLAAGFDHFIEKPLDPDKLKGLIDTPIESTPTPSTSLDTSLMDYLAQNDPAGVAKLEARYRASFIEELEYLEQTLQGAVKQTQRDSIHKLKGLVNFKKDAVLSGLLSELSGHIEADASMQTCASICQQMKAHITQPQPKN
jgi:signal transduction histidine kinase/CheY-like chemotaxis protein